MTTRTVQFYGRGFSLVNTECEITFNFDNNIIFQGSVPTIYRDDVLPPEFPVTDDDCILLFTAEIDMKFSGKKPVTVTCSNGAVVIAKTLVNFVAVLDPNTEQASTSGANNFLPPTPQDSKSNITVDGVAYAPERIEGQNQNGEWYVPVAGGTVVTYDLEFESGATAEEINAN